MGTPFFKKNQKGLDFCTGIVYSYVRAQKEVSLVTRKIGRPTESKKTERLEIRLAPNEMKLLQDCASALNTTKTDVINRGVQLVKSELDKK
jgi:hypothetical protein